MRNRVFLSLLTIFLCADAQSVLAAGTSVAVKAGTRGVPMLSYQLGKGCAGLATVRAMTFVYEGSSSKDIRHLYAKVNGRRVTRNRNINEQDLRLILHLSAKLHWVCAVVA